MKTIITFLFTIGCLLISSCSVNHKNKEMEDIIEHSLSIAARQSMKMAKSLIKEEGKLPRTIVGDTLRTSSSSWWTSGFFPGTLWYLYEATGNDSLKYYAEKFTSRIEKEQYTTNNHDVGFMLYCSYGNGFRLTGNKQYEKILLQGAKSLDTRFNQSVGCIRSWDWNSDIWKYPVIIDNMMNLELLSWASKTSKDTTFINHANQHAQTTMRNHFRPDYSSYHVVSYDPASGKPHIKQTEQGYSDESSWARGQAWALYGFTMMYRETQKKEYLEQSVNIADFIVKHPNLPEDKIPYWDFNAPDIPNALRDASAGAIIASALIELSLYTKPERSQTYLSVAEQQIKALSSENYLALPNSNCNFILKHSVGNMPHNGEIDTPLTYADYYYVEALLRYRKNVLKNN